jgi:hypothetical protein
VRLETWHVTNKDSLPGGEEEGGGLVRLETWHVTNEDSQARGEEEGGAGWSAWKRGTSQTRTRRLEGRKREERVGELGNEAHHKRGLTAWRGRRGGVSR